MELGYCTHGRKPIGMIVKSMICFIKQCPVTLYNCAKGVIPISVKWLQSLSPYLKWNFPLPDCVYLFVCESAIMLSMTLYLHVLFCVLYMSVRLSEGGCIAT